MGNRSGYTSSGKGALAKAQKFTEAISSHGWQCKTTFDEGLGVTHLFARRSENETITIHWHEPNGRIIPNDLPVYTLMGEPIKLRNVSAAVSIAVKPTDVSRAKKSSRRARRRIDALGRRIPAPGERLTNATGSAIESLDAISAYESGSLPFDRESTDTEISIALKGRPIAWLNSQSHNVENGVVRKLNKVVRNGRDYIDFVDDTGFHAVYLDKIVSVG